jgi:DNA transformation protein
MAVNASLVELLKEQLAPLGRIGVRRMFGGAGVFCDGLMFGLIAWDTLYFKADEANRAAYEAEGMEAFTYDARGKPIRMSYWRVPERLFDEPEEMVEWGRAALAAARRAGAGRKPAARRRTRPSASARLRQG